MLHSLWPYVLDFSCYCELSCHSTVYAYTPRHYIKQCIFMIVAVAVGGPLEAAVNVNNEVSLGVDQRNLH